jgi:hypothetical protein
MDAKLGPVEEEAEEVVAEVHLDPPPKERKSKKADKDRTKKSCVREGLNGSSPEALAYCRF